MCNACDEGLGFHTVCIEASAAFLEYSRFKDNDLSTPVPELGFPGLRGGLAGVFVLLVGSRPIRMGWRLVCI